jgi:VCBS repeat-containing protein
MSKSKKHGGSSGRDGHHDRGGHHDHDGDTALKLRGTKGDDVLTGSNFSDKIHGGKGNDKLFGLAGNDVLDGGKGNDTLDGGPGCDLLIGGSGSDVLQGGEGDDTLYGDNPGKGHGWAWAWGKCHWWGPQTGYADFLDGGAGNDKVYAGRGDDFLFYSMQANLGAGFADIGTHDSYDGGTGFDTLLLGLTYGELLLDSVTADIDAFEQFLGHKANPRSDHGKTFQFKSFDLDVRNVEAYEIRFINNAPTANDDDDATDEDTLLLVPAPGVLANDTDPDHLDVLAVSSADALSEKGAAVLVGEDGSLSYDPREALALQQLAQGTSTTDSFSYTIVDLGGEHATATARILVHGVNDKPLAVNDEANLLVTGTDGGPIEVSTLDFTGAPSETPFVAGDYRLSGFFGNSDTGEPLAAVNTGADPNVVVVGTVVRVDGEEFSALSVDVALLFGAHSVAIYGYLDGSPVDGLVEDVEVTPEFDTMDFGAAWTGIDELRFEIVGLSNDYLLIDNLRLGFGEGGGGGVVVEPIDIDVLANDMDVDIGDVISVVASQTDTTSARGAAISVNANGTIHYDPTGADIPPLDPGETAIDTFQYAIADSAGVESVATVSVVLQGAEEPALPVASALSAPDIDLI